MLTIITAQVIPIQNPVLIFAVILITILAMPLLFKKLSIPGIIGLIIAGILLGPKGIGLLNRDASIELFGMVGLLYIMFIAGLEIDIDEFFKNKYRSIIFGALTFSVPMILGYIGAVSILKLELLPAILLASMFASHTLLAYPIASRYGITKNESVTITVGGTIITDVLALIVLAVIVGIENGNMTSVFWVKIIVSFIVLILASFWALPKLTVWFFRNISEDGEQQFIYVLLCVFILASLTGLAGVEPIIGAFFAGLSLNRYVPPSSPLMNRIHFVGNTIFIPFFLISVGMLVDIRVLFTGAGSILAAVTMTIIAISAKFIAAFITQKLFGYSKEERNVIFGLSNSQAAATLAAVIIAYRIGMFDDSILNGTIVMILVTCLLSSFVIERDGRKLAVLEEEKVFDENEIPERILIPVSDQNNIQQLIDFAVMIKDSGEPLYALTVFKEDSIEPAAAILKNNKKLDKAVDHASSGENILRVISRVDLNIANGILRAIKELVITDVVLDWRGKFKSKHKIIGNILDQLLGGSNKNFYICRLVYPINTISRIIILVPDFADYEKGFIKWAVKIKKLVKETRSKLVFYGGRQTLISVKHMMTAAKPAIDAEYHETSKIEVLNWEQNGINANDLFLFISARNKTISWYRGLDNFPKRFINAFPDINFIVLYPEQ